MFEGAFDPKWKNYEADEWSDALVAVMKLGGVEHLFFVSGSEIGFIKKAWPRRKSAAGRPHN